MATSLAAGPKGRSHAFPRCARLAPRRSPRSEECGRAGFARRKTALRRSCRRDRSIVRGVTIAFITHPDCWLHEMGEGHPERPERLSAIEDRLIASRLDNLVTRFE